MKSLSEQQVDTAGLVREQGFLRTNAPDHRFDSTVRTFRRDPSTRYDHCLVHRWHGAVECPRDMDGIACLRGGHISEVTKIFYDARSPGEIVNMLCKARTGSIVCDKGQAV